MSELVAKPPRFLSLFFALSRTQHGVLDMAMPAFCALAYLGHFPSGHVILLGMLASFAGYTAIYALNDIIDCEVDREKMKDSTKEDFEGYIDAALIRHPIAERVLSMKAAMAWMLGWSAVTFVAGYLLNPMICAIFLAAGFLEVVYCKLFKKTWLRIFVSGVVKSAGPIAAIFAVDMHPNLAVVGGFFVWLFCWELGGQNIPADWCDMEEDKRLHAKTLPVVLGQRVARSLIVVTTFCAAFLGGQLLLTSPAMLPVGVGIIAALIGMILLVRPALLLYRSQDRRDAMRLFNGASYYPLSLLVLLLASWGLHF